LGVEAAFFALFVCFMLAQEPGKLFPFLPSLFFWGFSSKKWARAGEFLTRLFREMRGLAAVVSFSFFSSCRSFFRKAVPDSYLRDGRVVCHPGAGA